MHDNGGLHHEALASVSRGVVAAIQVIRLAIAVHTPSRRLFRRTALLGGSIFADSLHNGVVKQTVRDNHAFIHF